MKGDYEPISYYSKAPNIFTNTMQFLHWFRFFVRNSDRFIRVPTPDSLAKFPAGSVRLFYIMRSDERTHVPCTYTINAAKPLTYAQWRDLIPRVPVEKEINAVLQKEVRNYLEWGIYEFIGWTSDGLIQNPEENKQAFRITGHIT